MFYEVLILANTFQANMRGFYSIALIYACAAYPALIHVAALNKLID